MNVHFIFLLYAPPTSLAYAYFLLWRTCVPFSDDVLTTVSNYKIMRWLRNSMLLIRKTLISCFRNSAYRKKTLNSFVLYLIVRIFANNIQDMEEKKDYTVIQEQLARFAKALGHPARIAIMHFLAKQETCYFGDIHEELPIAKATVSQHLKELKDAGLIQGEVETPKVKYCINRENWKLARELFKEFFGQSICKSGECCE